ncbi:MAG: anti-sigma factor domain-containing protein, partial [Nitrospirales bacterium]
LTGCKNCHAGVREHQAVTALLAFQAPPVPVHPELRARLHTTRQTATPTAFAAPSSSSAKAASGQPPFTVVVQSYARVSRFRRLATRALIVLSLVMLGGAAYYGWSVQSQAVHETTLRTSLETALQQERDRLSRLQAQLSEQDLMIAEMRRMFTQRTGSVSDLRDSYLAQQVQLEQARRQLAQRTQELAKLRKALVDGEELARFFQSPRVEVIRLTGTTTARQAGGFLLYDPDTRKGLLYAFNLPQPAQGRTYRLWAYIDQPVVLGVLSPDAGRKVRLLIQEMPDPSEISQLTLIEESEASGEQPLGPPTLLAEL